MRRVIARYFKKCLYRAKNKYCSVILCVVKNIPLKKRAVHMPRALSVGYFAIAQYDVKSPIGALRHFAYAADAPLLSLSRHFPRFSGGIYPEGGSKICLCERSEAISREGGGLRSIFSVLFQGDCRGTSRLAMTTRRAMVRWDISLALNMT